MKKQIIDGLIELGIFTAKYLSKDEYESLSQNDTSKEHLYMCIRCGDENETKLYKQIDTKGLTEEEAKLLLEIDRTKNIRSIKTMAIFFVVLTLISIAIAIWSGLSIASML